MSRKVQFVGGEGCCSGTARANYNLDEKEEKAAGMVEVAPSARTEIAGRRQAVETVAAALQFVEMTAEHSNGQWAAEYQTKRQPGAERLFVDADSFPYLP